MGTVADLVGCFGDQDFFSFPVTAGQTITFTVDAGPVTAPRTLKIREPGGNTEGENLSGGVTTTTLTATADGTAKVGVRFLEEPAVPYEITIGVGD